MLNQLAVATPETRLHPGMPVEIVSGPLKGLRGTVIRRQGTKVLKFAETGEHHLPIDQDSSGACSRSVVRRVVRRLFVDA